jgi:Rgg/GadR/MutR family transcriptional activator
VYVLYWNFGQFYQKIRKEKGLSQEKVCGKMLSRTTLSKIENGRSTPSYDLFSYLLKQIDMSFDEFEFVCNHFQMNERESLMIKFENLLSNSDIQAMKKIKNECMVFLEKNNDCGLIDLITVIDSLIIFHRSDSIDNAEARKLIEKVWQKLSAIDTWYYHEIRLINSILMYFPIKTVLNFSVKLIDSLKKYEEFTKTTNSFCLAVYTNLSTIFLYHKLYKECLENNKIILKLSKNAKRYDFYCFALIRIGICSKNFKKTQEGIKQLKFFGETKLIKEAQKEIKMFFGNDF